jgi:hypothetical protein
MRCVSLENALKMERKVVNKNKGTRRVTCNNYRKNHVLSPDLNQPTRLKPKKMDEIRVKKLPFNTDSKYSKGCKYNENKLFYIGC